MLRHQTQMTEQTETFLDKIGRFIAGRLTRPSSGYEPYTPSDPLTLYKTLKPGDCLLVEGNQKVSAAIKYLTQSTWSHSALYVGNVLDTPDDKSERPRLIEVNLGEGCVAVPLSKYCSFNTRICRPVGLTDEDRDRIVNYMVKALGTKYDTKNILDLARYLIPTPPVPVRWRRRMLALGSGEPTRAICSSLMARAYQSVDYPILPIIERNLEGHMHSESAYSDAEILHIRHHSLFTPRDFDISPYFQVIKPTIEHGFDYQNLNWAETSRADAAP